HKECENLVEVTESRRVLHFKDLDKISVVYCDFKEQNGKALNRDSRSRKDNFKNILNMKIRNGCLQKFGNGTEDGKEFLKYEVKNQEWWNSLTRSYTVVKGPGM
ncbi:Hypothetical predicted protein, partial [Paramuricea clavata]